MKGRGKNLLRCELFKMPEKWLGRVLLCSVPLACAMIAEVLRSE